MFHVLAELSDFVRCPLFGDFWAEFFTEKKTCLYGEVVLARLVRAALLRRRLNVFVKVPAVSFGLNLIKTSFFEAFFYLINIVLK